MASKYFSIVVAATQKGGIGLKGSLPWPLLSKDLKFFKDLTSNAQPSRTNAVIMGRRTWDSLPSKFRPLPNRFNIVMSQNAAQLQKDIGEQANVVVASSFHEALDLAQRQPSVDRIFVMGGGDVYKTALQSDALDRIYLTQVLKDMPCDTFIPPVDPVRFQLEHLSDLVVENNIPYQFQFYKRKSAPVPQQESKAFPIVPEWSYLFESKESSPSSSPSSSSSSSLPSHPNPNPEEQQYLDMVRDIIKSGVKKMDRTGTGTLSKFGMSARFSLRDGRFPLLTTKRVYWKGVVEELLWFVKGCTDANALAAKNVKIWDGNGSRAFLDSIGQGHRQQGDLGPVYGFQWRHFGATYVDCKFDYSGKGVDQLADVIRTIKTNPDSRRILMSAWNPCDLSRMALPPCHVLAQFYVANGELSCVMYQRSCDMGLGVPFNIASYALLTVMVAHVCGLKPGDFVHMMGDTHVYLNHVEPLRQQMQRTPSAFPTLHIKRQVDEIESFTFDDFELSGYQPQPTIKMDMAV